MLENYVKLICEYVHNRASERGMICLKKWIKKFISTVLSTLAVGVVGVVLMLQFMSAEGLEPIIALLGFMVVIMLFTLFGNIVYGIPVSMLSDFVSKRVPPIRFTIAACIYIVFAYVTYFIVEGYYIYAVGAAVFFFLAEEVQNLRARTFQFKWITVNVMLTIALVMGGISVHKMLSEEEEPIPKTYRQYLIPDGYEGVIIIGYNMPGEEKLESDDGQKVIPITKKEVTYTYVGDTIQYAGKNTSTGKPRSGTEDSYYYVDENGEQTKLPNECVYHPKPRGSDDDDTNVEYETIQITTACGEQFRKHGSDHYDYESGLIYTALND